MRPPASPTSRFAVFAAVILSIWIGFPQPNFEFEHDVVPIAKVYSGLDGDRPLTGVNVVITGATSGIGLGLTMVFAKLGATVIAMGRSPTKLQNLAASTYGNIVPILVSLNDLSSVQQASIQIAFKFQKIDILINNAGIHYGGMPFHKPHTPQGYDESFAVNYLSHVLLTEHMIPLLKKATNVKPTIIQISSSYHWGSDGSQLKPGVVTGAPLASSWQSYWPWGNQRAYNDSKLAQILHARALQRRYPDIAIKSICPGWVGTSIGGDVVGIFLKGLAFPSHGYGLASTLQAIFTNETTDWLTNSKVSAFSKLFPSFLLKKWATDFMLRDFMMIVMASLLLWCQKIGGHVQAMTKSSPESYDRELQESLYEWSKQEILDYL